MAFVQAPPVETVRAGISPRAMRVEADAETSGIVLATPCYGGQVVAPFMHGVVDTHVLCERNRIPLVMMTLHSESLVQRARNHLVARFLASKASHLVFIDADIGFTGQSVLRLVGHDLDVVAAPYRKKDRAKVDWALNVHGGETAEMDPRTGVFQCRHVATGFLCIKRRVLETLYDRHPEWHYRLAPTEGEPGPWRDMLSSIFDCFRWPDTPDGAYLSEDWGFCHRAEAEGFKIWCDPGIILQHYGVTDFAADPTIDFYPRAIPASAPEREVEVA